MTYPNRPIGVKAGSSSEHSLGCFATGDWSWIMSATCKVSETLIEVAMIRLLLARLGRQA